MYRMIATFCGVRYVGVPLREDFSLDFGTAAVAIMKEKPAVIFIAYPNNPTGSLFAVEDIEAIIKAAPGLVVIDEAYTPFAGKSFLPRLAEFPGSLIRHAHLIQARITAALRLEAHGRCQRVDGWSSGLHVCSQHQFADSGDCHGCWRRADLAGAGRTIIAERTRYLS